MKKIFSLIILVCAFSTSIFAQKTYEVLSDPANNGAPMFKGIVQKSDLISEPTFSWYAESQRVYQKPDTSIVNALKNHRDLYFIVFGGTWCSDTHYVLPKFFKVQEAANFPENHIALYAVDHNKLTTGNIALALGVTHVPTIIVMQNGKELGRVVEYGTTGRWDKELAQIINEKAL